MTHFTIVSLFNDKHMEPTQTDPISEQENSTIESQNQAANAANDTLENSSWGRFIPWFLSITCIGVLAVIGNFLIENVEWFKQTAYEIQLINAQEPVYRIHTYHMHMSMIKNSVGIFSGFAIMFLGLGVAFYSLKKQTNLDVQSKVWSASVATASPGIIALLVGGTIIMYCVGNKSDFPPFPIIFEQGAKVVYPDTSGGPEFTVQKDDLPIINSPFDTAEEISLDSIESSLEIAH